MAIYDRRTSGILLHPTSLPGEGGIGELGSAAYQFVDWLVQAKQQRWQIIPLGPTGFGNSPYASPSAMAGNPLLISIERLAEEGLLPADARDAMPPFSPDRVNYEAVSEWKLNVLQRAHAAFTAGGRPKLRADFEAFQSEHAKWLDDFALFTALQEAHGGAAWNTWEPALRRRDPHAIAQSQTQLAERIDFHKFTQWLFFRQWLDLKQYANERDILIIGDIPIFVAYNSADVWANPDIFYLDAQGNSTVVAGVPPDYFSATGQRWGNPLYRWDILAQHGYSWWVERFRMMLTLVDIVRLDHFRGFEAYWEIPAKEETAVKGRWVKGPSSEFFQEMRNALGELPIIAEDLGLITPDVIALRDEQGFPGMAVLQFAWADAPTNPYQPHNHERNLVVYTGTHDNDTTVGWWHTSDEEVRSHARRYLGITGDDISWEMIKVALMSVADTAIIPMQDVLSLGNEGRMNIPGSAEGNWSWRLLLDQLSDELAEQLADLTQLYGRVPIQQT